VWVIIVNKKWAVSILIVGIVVLISALLYFIVPQEAIGYAPTLSECNSRVQSWCTDGYACTSCTKQTLGYYLQFSSGSTNIVYTADCVYGVSNTGSGHTACGGSNVVSHAKYHCYGNDVYWYNSVGAREDLKTSCSYRCEDYTLDSARCVSAPSCASQGQSCGSPTLPSCCSGLSCQNFGCYPTTVTPPSGCSNACSFNGLFECTSATAFRTCALVNDCLVWQSGKICPTGQVCDGASVSCIPAPECTESTFVRTCTWCVNGRIVSDAKCNIPVSPDWTCSNGACIPPATCEASVTCSNDKDILSVSADCSSKTTSCSDGTSCVDGQCVNIPPPRITCDGVTCDSYCMSDFTAYTQGSCSEGVCTYGSIVTMSPKCLPSNNTVNCTTDLYGVEPCGSGERQLVASCINGNYKYIVYDSNQCVEKTFIQKYGLYIAGGVFLLALVIFIINFVPKGRGRKR
jgi:hypothetical protein